MDKTVGCSNRWLKSLVYTPGNHWIMNRWLCKRWIMNRWLYKRWLLNRWLCKRWLLNRWHANVGCKIIGYLNRKIVGCLTFGIVIAGIVIVGYY